MKQIRQSIGFGAFSRHFATAASIAALLSAAQAAAEQPPSVRFAIEASREDLTLAKEPVPGGIEISRLRLRGADLSEEPGYPRLPFFTRAAAIPRGAKVERVSAAPGEEISIGDVGLVSWGQPPRPARGPIHPGGGGAGDPLLYSESGAVGLDPSVNEAPYWPPEAAEVTGDAYLGGYRIVSIRIYPLRWYHRESRLGLFASLAVDLIYSGGEPHRPRGKYVEAMEIEDLKSLVVNPEVFLAPPIPRTRTTTARSTSPTP